MSVKRALTQKREALIPFCVCVGLAYLAFELLIKAINGTHSLNHTIVRAFHLSLLVGICLRHCLLFAAIDLINNFCFICVSACVPENRFVIIYNRLIHGA